MRPAPTTVPKLPPVTMPIPEPSAAPVTAPFCPGVMFSHPVNSLAAASASMIVFFLMQIPWSAVRLNRLTTKITDCAANQASAHHRSERRAGHRCDAGAQRRAAERGLLGGAHVLASSQQARRGE